MTPDSETGNDPGSIIMFSDYSLPIEPDADWSHLIGRPVRRPEDCLPLKYLEDMAMLSEYLPLLCADS